MMDAAYSKMYCRLLLLLLGVCASLVLAKPRAKAELARGGSSRIPTDRSTMVASSRRSLLRRRVGSPVVVQAIKDLAEYKEEIARKMTNVRTPEEFLRVFYPVDAVKSRWAKMVNESVQNAWRAGRTGAEGTMVDRPTFTEETADRELAEVYSHGNNVRCREPKPVLIDMYEELNLTRGGLVFVYPECTLVRRCEGSGCCQGGAPCVGKESTRGNISRPFIIMKVIPDDSMHKNARYTKHSLYADTECVCQERPNLPVCPPTACSHTMTFNKVTCRCLCNKPCPRPFKQNPDTCDCQCAEKDGGCNKIKRSRRRMAATDCTCVMDDRCQQPACKKGYSFSTSSCKCTQKSSGKQRDRNGHRGGRTGTQSNLPYPPPSHRRGRTNINPTVPFGTSSSEEQPSDSPTGSDPTLIDSSTDSEDPQFLSQGGLVLSWHSEASPRGDCGSSCQSESAQEKDSGSGGGGGVGGQLLDF